MTPQKEKLQKEQIKELEAIDAQLGSKNYATARGLIKNYVKRFENES